MCALHLPARKRIDFMMSTDEMTCCLPRRNVMVTKCRSTKISFGRKKMGLTKKIQLKRHTCMTTIGKMTLKMTNGKMPFAITTIGKMTLEKNVNWQNETWHNNTMQSDICNKDNWNKTLCIMTLCKMTLGIWQLTKCLVAKRHLAKQL